MNLMTQIGSITLDHRLDRLARTLHGRANRALRERGLDFDHRWTPVYRVLAEKGPASLNQLSEILDLDHPSLLHITRPMIESGFLQIHRNRLEGHTRLYELTEKGASLRDELYDFWEDLDHAHQDLFHAVQCDLRLLLDRLEQGLDDDELEIPARDEARPIGARHMSA